jgi:hypothetical protein
MCPQLKTHIVQAPSRFRSTVFSQIGQLYPTFVEIKIRPLLKFFRKSFCYLTLILAGGRGKNFCLLPTNIQFRCFIFIVLRT